MHGLQASYALTERPADGITCRTQADFLSGGVFAARNHRPAKRLKPWPVAYFFGLQFF